MHPQPLAWILADPTLDHTCHRLHRAGDIDHAVGVPRQSQGRRQFQPEPTLGQADDADAVDRAIVVPGELGQERVGKARPAEELDHHAAGEMLVDQLPEMAAILDHVAHGEDGAGRGGREAAHGATADLLDELPGRADENELGLTYEQIDDYLEGREVDTDAATAIEHRYWITRHKRTVPVSIFDSWWRE